MDEEANTPQDPNHEAEVVVMGSLASDRGEKAYELKLAGKTLSQIADQLGFRDTTDVSHAINSRFRVEAQFLTDASRQGILQLEFDRLERLIEVLWPSAMTGDPRSTEAVLKVMDREIKITGLDAVDTATQSHTVLVVAGNERSYIERLKELADE